MQEPRSQNELRQAVQTYCDRYGIEPAFELSALYHLENDWRGQQIPNALGCGCYVFYDSAMELLYIGKVSLNHTLGRRVASYFMWNDETTSLDMKHQHWTRPPAYLQTIKVNEPYEAPSLEEYLLLKLQPIDNTRMARAQAEVDPGSS
jgi:hypothetical protein